MIKNEHFIELSIIVRYNNLFSEKDYELKSLLRGNLTYLRNGKIVQLITLFQSVIL